MINKYIEKEIENYGVLKVTSLGKKFLAKPSSFKISKDNDFNDEPEEATQMSGGSCAVDSAQTRAGQMEQTSELHLVLSVAM